MTNYYPLNKLYLILFFFIIASCSDSTETDAENSNNIDSTVVEDNVEQENSEILFRGVFNTAGYLESRAEMVEVLGRIGVHDYSGVSWSFVNVEKTADGFVQTCDYDYNGSIDFLFSGSETLGEFYDNFEPVFEHNSQDLFPYMVEDIYVNPSEKQLVLKTRNLQRENEVFGVDMAIPHINLKITENPDFGPIMEFNDRFFMREDFYNSIPAKECEDYEP